SFETFALVIVLATSRVLARSAPGRVQPAAGVPDGGAGLLAVTAFPVLAGQADAVLLVLLVPQPPTARPAASSREKPVTADRRPGPVMASSRGTARRSRRRPREWRGSARRSWWRP